jgi:hypothetical protein
LAFWILVVGIGPAAAIASPPTPYRTDTISIVDLQRNRLIVFGGRDSAGYQDDTWALSLASLGWTRLNPTGAPPGANPTKSAFYSRNSDEMLVLAATLDSVWALSLGSAPHWSLMRPGGTIPPARSGAALGFDPIRSRIVMYAGATCTPFCTLDDVWAFELDSATWTLLHANGSPGSGGSQTGCLGAFDAPADRFLVTGGNPNGGVHLRSNNTVRSYAGTGDTWTTLKSVGFDDLVFPVGFFEDPGRARLLALQSNAGLWRSSTGATDPWTVTAAGTNHSLSFGPSSVAYDSLVARVLLVAADGTWQAPLQGTQGWTQLMPPSRVPPPASSEFALVGAIENPSHAGLEVAFRLPDDRPATLSLHDVGGRVLRRVEVRGVGAHTLALGAGLALKPGLYFLSLAQAGRQVCRRAAVLR